MQSRFVDEILKLYMIGHDTGDLLSNYTKFHSCQDLKSNTIS